LSTVAVGLGATLLMDLLGMLLKRSFGIPSADYCLVGRWFCHMPQGTFTHPNIVKAARKRFECAVGWIAHYVIGVLYALMLVAIVSASWLAQPSLLPALIFGLCTVVVPFLVMHPSFGFGIAGSKTPDPPRAMLRSLMAHVAFGIGLYVCAVGVAQVLRVQVQLLG
jgi:DUF2938 family protein